MPQTKKKAAKKDTGEEDIKKFFATIAKQNNRMKGERAAVRAKNKGLVRKGGR